MFNVHPVEIDSDKKIVTLSNGEVLQYENLINSIPLRDFLKLQTGLDSEKSHEISSRMKIASVSYLNAAFKTKPGHVGHWFYIPEEKYMPYRIGSFSNIYAELAPDGKGSAYIEYTHQGDFDEVEKFKNESVKMMKDMKFIESDDQIEFMDYRIIKDGYVIYHKEYFDDMKTVEDWCSGNRIQLVGRYGKWTYAAMENAIIEGLEAAEKIMGE